MVPTLIRQHNTNNENHRVASVW